MVLYNQRFDLDSLSTAIADYGFPIIAVLGLLWFVYFIWKFITEQIKPKLAETNRILIGLIDRIRVLDNDLIRLQQKLNTYKNIREFDNGKNKSNKKGKARD